MQCAVGVKNSGAFVSGYWFPLCKVATSGCLRSEGQLELCSLWVLWQSASGVECGRVVLDVDSFCVLFVVRI